MGFDKNHLLVRIAGHRKEHKKWRSPWMGPIGLSCEGCHEWNREEEEQEPPFQVTFLRGLIIPEVHGEQATDDAVVQVRSAQLSKTGVITQNPAKSMSPIVILLIARVVLLDADPPKNIANTREINAVILQGQFFSKKTDSAHTGQIDFSLLMGGQFRS